MRIIYCLYSTRDGKPRYVGETDQASQARLGKHEGDAKGDPYKKPELVGVHPWMRKEWFSGHDIEIFPIPSSEDANEEWWIMKFPNLLNIRHGYRSPRIEKPEGRAVRKKCEKEARKRKDNYGRFHGITYYPTEDAYTVTAVCWGNPLEFCQRWYVEGDSLPGTDRPRCWFTDINRAIETRDIIRKKVYEDYISPWYDKTPRWFKWPPDRTD